MDPDGFNYFQAPCARPEAFSGYDSYRLLRTRGVREALKWMLSKATAPGERCVVLLDWVPCHLSEEVADIVKAKGHVLMFHGGGTTSFTQVNDTHIHSNTPTGQRIRDICRSEHDVAQSSTGQRIRYIYIYIYIYMGLGLSANEQM